MVKKSQAEEYFSLQRIADDFRTVWAIWICFGSFRITCSYLLFTLFPKQEQRNNNTFWHSTEIIFTCPCIFKFHLYSTATMVLSCFWAFGFELFNFLCPFPCKHSYFLWQWFCKSSVWGTHCIDIGWFTLSIIVVDYRAGSSSGAISRFVALLNRALHLIDS